MAYPMIRAHLLSATILAGLLATTAGAQTAPAAPPPAPREVPATEGEVVVTGTLFRRNNTETASPVQIVTSLDLQQRGINTVADALQTLTSNNAGSLPTAFSANGAFANGAAGASLRGLTTDSTLVLFDGLRAAYYPLADDGARNFVDLNTIPNSIVERVEVLKDGASSTYGADAVAGVINVIVRKQIKGLEATAESAISSRGDAPEQRFALTYGWGDLATNGFNIYANGEYQHNELLFNSQRGFPFNTSNLSSISTLGPDGVRVYGNNGDVNGFQGDGSFPGGNPGATGSAVVRPATAAGGLLPDGTFAADGTPNTVPGVFRLLNPGAGCRGLQANNVGVVDGTDYGTLCEQDTVRQYGVIQPSITRIGGTLHATANIGANAQAYAMFNYYQSKVGYPTTPASIRTQTNSGDFSTTELVLPITLTNGQLNPNNPYAAQGQYARIFYRFADIPSTTESLSKTYRGAIGISGHFGDAWNYSADATGMATDLRTTVTGVPYFANVLKVIADGTYNFVNPELNSQAIRNFVAPTSVNNPSSKLYQGQAQIAKSLFHLPGGRLQVAVGGSVRYEEIDDPSANPANPTPDPSQQYYPLINGFGAKGSRYVYSGFYEVKAPVFDQLELSASGRYDNYSTGFDRFSPKFGAIFRPLKQLTLRGTFSKGFRTPSFAETGALPTTGFVTVTPGNGNTGFANAHSNAQGPSQYLQPYGLGLTTSGTPGLKPEISTNWTAGVILKPRRWLTINGEYYNISKKDVITGADYSTAVAAYYAGQPIPTGFNVVQDIPDPQFPNAQRRIFAVGYGFVNGNSQLTDGVDFGLTANATLPYGFKLTSSGNATYIFRLNETVGGATRRYAGTLGPFAITSASGTPQWRATWQNTIEKGQFTVTSAAYYTSGYRGTADDFSGAGTSGSCANAIATYVSNNPDIVIPLRCNVRDYVQFDFTGSVKVGENTKFYLNLLNAFDAKPPFDPNTYGGANYNPAFTQGGIVGRYIRAGISVQF